MGWGLLARGAILLGAVLCMTPGTFAQGLAIGQPAPDFKLPGVDGKDYTLASFRDADVLVIVFACNHCPTSQRYEERLARLVDEFKDEKVAVVAISPNDNEALRLDELGTSDLDDSFESMKLRAADREFPYPYLYDGETQETSKAFGPTVTPEAFVLDRDRKLRYRGRIDDSVDEAEVRTRDVHDAIAALLAGKHVPLERTRPFGCSVKWSSLREEVAEANEQYAEEPVAIEAIAMKLAPAIMANRTGALRLVHFWSNDDEDLAETLDALVVIDRMYRRHPLLVMSVNIEGAEAKDAALKTLREHEASFMNVLLASEEGDGPVERTTIAEKVDKEWDGGSPYTVLIAPGGEILWRSTGPFDALKLRREILKKVDELFTKRPMPPTNPMQPPTPE